MTYQRFRKDALGKFGPVPSDIEGKEALKAKLWSQIKDLQLDQMMAEKNGHDMKRLQNELYLRYAMSTILSRAIRKEMRDAK